MDSLQTIYVYAQLALELDDEIRKQNVGIADVKNVFRRKAGPVDRAKLTYENGKQVLSMSGHRPDGSPYAITSAPFGGCPIAKSKQLAAELEKMQMSSILGAGYLGQRARQRVADAKARLAKAGEKFEGAIGEADKAAGNLEGVADQIAKEAADLTATAAQLTNGPPEE